jgi:hypothetical protein
VALGKLEFSRGEMIASKYEVSDLLDESPLGVTHRAKHIKSGKYVRLLMLRPKVAGHAQKDQLVEIFKKVKEIQHPGLVKFGELAENEGVAYVTYEDFEGRTLRELLTEYRVEGKRLELKEAAQITVQILEALDTLHQNGVVLRALRPEYVLINARHTGPRNRNFVARIKLIGAGLWDLVPSGALAEDEFSRGETQYLAPELKGFEPNATPRCDIYSAGVIFYELITGAPPLGTYQAPTTLRAELPRVVNDIVELALANSPDDRYPSTQDFLAAVQRTAIDAPEADNDPGRRLVPFAVAGVLGFILLAAIGSILYMVRTGPDDGQIPAAKDVEVRNAARQKLQVVDAATLQALLKTQPPNMAYIPGGTFVQGRMNVDPLALATEPLTKMVETKPFLIDQYEYPNQIGAPPMSEVDYATADSLCAKAGKRLCTDLEWEKACKGPTNAIYGYASSTPADVFDPDFCGNGLADKGYASGSKDQCKSGYSVFDVSGNYREWTSTEGKDGPTRRVVKGGMRGNPERGTRCAYSNDENQVFNDPSMSFRCCRDVDAPPWVPPAP